MAKARPANVLQINHEQAKALANRVGETEVLRLLHEAEADLQKRLQQAIQTGSTTPMNIATMEQTLAQVRAVTHGVAAKLGKVVLGASGKAGELGADGVLRYLQAAQQSFGGQARPLALREASMLSRAVQGANASVLGRIAEGEAPRITYSRSPRAKADGDVLVKVPASKFDALWSRDDAGYLGAGDPGIGKRREGVSAFVKKRGELYASQVVYDPFDGKVVVVDGRHRLATLRDAGAGELVVSVPAENLADFIKATGGAPALAHNEVKASVPGSLAPDSYEPPLGGVLRRYGAATIETFEGVLRTGILTRKPWGDMRDELVQASPFLQGQPKFWAERIVRTECLVGETPVSGAMVRAVFRRWYEGPVVEVITKGGRKFTTTPNHPMLTRDGWVGSGELRPGDDLVCYRGQQRAGASGDEHVDHGPTTIREVFDAFAAVGVRERRRTAQPDFHGDGRDGEVDVLRPHRMLGIGRFAPLHKPTAQQVFSPSGVLRARFCRRCGALLSIQQQPCLCRGALVDAGLLEAALDRAVRGAQVFRDRFGALTRLVAGDDVLRQLAFAGVLGCGEAVLCGVRSAAGLSGCPEKPLEGIRADVSRGGCLLGAQPGEIEFDCVVEIRWRVFRGHVFNLETPSGYYAINGAYTGNTIGAYNRAGWEGLRAADDDLGDVVKVLSATFDNRTGWDSYQVHGQLRRTDEPFEWAGGLYQHPPNRPNDREVVVPHRLSWPIPHELHPRSDAEVLAAWKRERRLGAPPKRPQMSTIPHEAFGKLCAGGRLPVWVQAV